MLFLVGIYNMLAQDASLEMSEKMKQVLQAGDSCKASFSADCHTYYQQLLHLGQEENFEKIDFLYYKIASYYFAIRSLDSAMHYTDIGIKISKDPSTRQSLLNNKAGILYDQGKTDSAIYYFVKLAEDLEKTNQEDKLAFTLANIGIMLGQQENNQKSIDYLLQSYHLLEKLKDSVDIVTISGNIAFGYYFLEEYENSKKWAFKTLQFKPIPFTEEGFIISHNTLSKIYLKSDLDSAAYHSLKGVSLARESNLLHQLGNNLSTYADILVLKNELSQAQKAMEEAVNVFREIEFIPGLSDALYVAGEISLKNNSFEKAANYLYESRKINDSLLSEKRFEIINDLNTKYETEKKERLLTEKELQIERQENKNKQIFIVSSLLILILVGVFIIYRIKHKNKFKQIEQEKQNAVLNSFINGEERERVRIAQELHDGLAALLSAAKMSLETLPFLSDESKIVQLDKTKKILDDTHAEIRQIAHNLMPFKLEKEGLIQAVEQFVNDLNETGIIHLKFENHIHQAHEFSPKIELMLYRIIQELTNNIIKHSQAKNASIIFTSAENKRLKIEVTDDGVGFDEKINTTSQGLYSIQQRLKSIGGNFTLTRNKIKGMQAVAEI